MAKTKTPFFGLGSRGSVGESITTQKRGRDTVIRRSPSPTDPYTINQAYQRWLYEYYSYLWTLQTTATRAEYAAIGSRKHRTAFQEWMSYNLKNLPDISAIYYMDRGSLSTVKDFSKNGNDGINYGASEVSGLIGQALSFNGSTDSVAIAGGASLAFTDEFTVEAFVKPTGSHPSQHETLFNVGNAANRITLSAAWNYGAFPVAVYNTEAPGWFPSTTTLTRDIWTTVHLVVRPGISVSFYFNGVLDNTVVMTSFPTLDGSADIGYSGAGVELLQGDTDHLIVYARALTGYEIRRNSLRRYPD